MSLDTFDILEKIRSLALAFPATHEKICFGTPGFYVDKKMFARMKEDETTLVIYNNERDEWIAQGAAFYITEHYRNYPMLLIDLLKVKQAQLHELLKTSWTIRASKKILKEHGSNDL